MVYINKQYFNQIDICIILSGWQAVLQSYNYMNTKKLKVHTYDSCRFDGVDSI